MIEGGGASAYPGIRVYILLALRGIAGPDMTELAERFGKVARYTNEDIGGEIVDLDADDRLRRSLGGTIAGVTLFEHIKNAVPAICISNKYVGDCANAEHVEVLSFADYAANQDLLFDLIDAKMQTAKERRGWVEFLEFLNDVIAIRPNLFGIGIDLNKPISKALERLK